MSEACHALVRPQFCIATTVRQGIIDSGVQLAVVASVHSKSSVIEGLIAGTMFFRFVIVTTITYIKS